MLPTSAIPLLLAARVATSADTTSAHAAGPRIEDLVPPLSLRVEGIYLDGGSIGGEIVDAQGRRLRFCFPVVTKVSGRGGELDDPRGLTVGTFHWRDPGARVLPRGGEEERDLIALLDETVKGEFPEQDGTPQTTPNRVVPGDDMEAHNRRACVRRIRETRRQLEAAARGEVTTPGWGLYWFGARPPLAIDSVVRDRRRHRWNLVVSDSAGDRDTLWLDDRLDPASPASGNLHQGIWLEHQREAFEHRVALAFVWAALGHEAKRGPSDSGPRRHEVLRRFVKERMGRILALGLKP